MVGLLLLVLGFGDGLAGVDLGSSPPVVVVVAVAALGLGLEGDLVLESDSHRDLRWGAEEEGL